MNWVGAKLDLLNLSIQLADFWYEEPDYNCNGKCGRCADKSSLRFAGRFSDGAKEECT